MIVRHFLLDVNEANAFIIACPETREAMLIDAGAFDPEIPKFLESRGLTLKKVFITHNHYDHTGGLSEYLAQSSAEVVASLGSIEGHPVSKRVRHGDTVSVGNLNGTVLATPGHTPEGVSLAFPGCAFTGDALFAGSVGGTASDADKERQLDAIRKHIFTLPPETQLHVGHGPSSTVAIESRHNPFFV